MLSHDQAKVCMSEFCMIWGKLWCPFYQVTLFGRFVNSCMFIMQVHMQMLYNI